ncbi:MAG: hypothetical protein IJD48_02565 [Clostridia bacterium]|nr:hypothetical protein [Clostridia bacterium]
MSRAVRYVKHYRQERISFPNCAQVAPSLSPVTRVLQFDKALGLKLDVVEEENKQDSLPQNVKDLAEQRNVARQQKNWAESDRLRDKILELGFKIKDNKDGYEIEKL